MILADRIGPDRVTTGAVAAEIGVTQAALFRHFPTKAELWKAVAEHVASRLEAAWAESLAEVECPIERIRALVTAQFAQIAAMPALPMLLFSRELNVENADLRATFQNRLKSFHALLKREVTTAQRAGMFRQELSAGDVAVLLSSLVQGTAIRWALGSRRFSLKAEGERLLNAYLRLLILAEG